MEIMTIPILCGELPKFLGAICYEGDKNVKRLEFTGAEPGLQYKLDMERTDGAKNVVDLVNQNGTLVLAMDGSVRIPAGRYQVQLRTIGDTVRHTNKAFLTVRDSIDAVNAFASGMPTEMEQMESRITDAMHRSEASAARAEEAAESVKAEVFIAEYGVTKYEEIVEAYDAGKAIFCRGNIEGVDGVVPLSHLNKRACNAVFTITFEPDVVASIVVDTLNPTGESEWRFELQESGIYIAEYGKTSWYSLTQAYDTGKLIAVNRDGYQYRLYEATSTQMEFRQPGTTNTPYVICTNANKWSYGNRATTATPTKHASSHSASGSDPITPEAIGAQPGFVKNIPANEDMDNYTSPGCYLATKANNPNIKNAAFDGEVGTFYRVTAFNADSSRVMQEAITNKTGAVRKKWRVLSALNGVSTWSAWQEECQVYIAKYDESINDNQTKVKEAWNVLTAMFGVSDNGTLLAHKTVFCKFPIDDDGQREYYMVPLSKITPNYASFRVMTSDTTMYTVYLRNPDSFDSTQWGWSSKKQAMVTTTTLNTKISALEKRLAALEGGDVT